MPNETKNETRNRHPKAEELKDEQLDQAQGGSWDVAFSMRGVIQNPGVKPVVAGSEDN